MVTDAELKKLFVDYNFMDSVIKKVVSYCPDLKIPYTRNDKKRKLFKDALNDIEWSSLQNETYDTLEENGDAFFEIYFNDAEDKIPKLRLLDSEKMQRALLDDKNRYKQYIYRERVEDDITSYTTGTVNTTNARDRVIVFERGRKIIFDPQFEGGKIVRDDDGDIIYTIRQIANRDSYLNDFPLIHVKGYKKQREEFSSIPAEKYIDPCLLLMQILSDIRNTNRNLGFPMITIIDGEVTAGSKRSPASIFGITSNNPETQAKLQDIQIKNDLNSMFEEFKVARDDLYNKAGLITPTLLEKLNIDSSRVIQQLNLPSENKIELYVDNTIKAFQLYFKILLKENDMYSDRTDKNISFQKPKFIIKSSPFDELLYEQSEIKSTKKSRQEIYIENGDSDSDIKLRKKEINEELVDENKDKSFAENEVVDRVSNGQNVDNNMINDV